jgi:hypothetical protein
VLPSQVRNFMHSQLCPFLGAGPISQLAQRHLLPSKTWNQFTKQLDFSALRPEIRDDNLELAVGIRFITQRRFPTSLSLNVKQTPRFCSSQHRYIFTGTHHQSPNRHQKIYLWLLRQARVSTLVKHRSCSRWTSFSQQRRQCRYYQKNARV